MTKKESAMIDDKKLQSKLNIPEYADLMTIKEFKEDCDNGLLIDYDGWGNLFPQRLESHIR